MPPFPGQGGGDRLARPCGGAIDREARFDLELRHAVVEGPVASERRAGEVHLRFPYVSGGFLIAAFNTGLVFHHFSIMSANRLDRGAAALVFVGYGFVSAGANLVTGFLVDRIPPRFLLSAALRAMVAAMLTPTSVASPTGVVVYGSILGVMQGMSQAIQSSVYAYYFGRLHIGAVKGLATTITVAGTAAGPLIVALGYDLSGSYGPVLAISAIVPAVLALVSPFLTPGARRPHPLTEGLHADPRQTGRAVLRKPLGRKFSGNHRLARRPPVAHGARRTARPRPSWGDAERAWRHMTTMSSCPLFPFASQTNRSTSGSRTLPSATAWVFPPWPSASSTRASVWKPTLSSCSVMAPPVAAPSWWAVPRSST